MKPKLQYTYKDWRDTKGLHRDVLACVSELEFIRDELRFLKDLVVENILGAFYGKPFELSEQIGTDLNALDNRTDRLLTEFKGHASNLQVLTDDNDVPNELFDYKKKHYQLMDSTNRLQNDIKQTKQTIFNMMIQIMRKRKQEKSL